MPTKRTACRAALALAILVAQDLAVVPLLLITNALGAPLTPQGMVLDRVASWCWRWRCWAASSPPGQGQELPLSLVANIC